MDSFRLLVDGKEPFGAFASWPYADQYLQQLEVRFAAIDGEGRRANQLAFPLELRTDSPPLPEARLRYSADVTLRRLPHTLVITVHDPASRLTAAARVEVQP